MGPTERPSAANRGVRTGTLIPASHLLIKVSSDFLTFYNGGSVLCESMVHQLKIITWDFNHMCLRVNKSLVNITI